MHKVIRLNLGQQFTLGEFVKAHYAAKALTDVAFAGVAAAELGFHLNDNHVSAVRAALGIPSTMELMRAQKPETIIARLEAAEVMIGKLMRRLDALERPRSD